MDIAQQIIIFIFLILIVVIMIAKITVDSAKEDYYKEKANYYRHLSYLIIDKRNKNKKRNILCKAKKRHIM